MSVVNQDLSEDLLKEFNEVARTKFGDKKGYKKKALIAAMEEWVAKWRKK
jgi:hypothetical protein